MRALDWLIVLASSIVILVITCLLSHHMGYEKGYAVRDKEAVAEINQAVFKRLEENTRLAQEHERQLQTLKKEKDDEISAVNRRAGELAAHRLRLPASVCPKPAGQAVAQGTEGHGTPAATVVVPEQVERDLRELTRRADTVTAECRADRKFIDDNGLRE